jgi:RNA polymerase sigma-70 factor (ECF subfamily)
VTSNRCIDILRRRKPMTPIDDAPPLIDEAVDIERHQQAVDQNRLIRRALGQLSKDQQHAIELVYYREMRQVDAAEMMGITIVALESILRRARQKLHTELASLRSQLEMI